MSDISGEESDMYDEEEQQEEEEDDDDEMSSESEQSTINTEAAVTHPYPTPPPDIEQAKTGVKEQQTKKPNGKAKAKTKDSSTTLTKGAAKRPSIISLAMDGMKALAERSGSSVPAIMKYIKSTGYEVADERRTSRLLLRSLKLAVTKGHVVQNKRSFKLVKQQKPAGEKKKKQPKEKKPMKTTTKKQAKPAAKKETKGGEGKEADPKQKKQSAPAVKKTAEKMTAEKKAVKKTVTKTKPVGKAKAIAVAMAEMQVETPPTSPLTLSSLPTPTDMVDQKVTKKQAEGKTTAKGKIVKVKAPRKSIGTLAQPHNGKVGKISRKNVRTLAAGKHQLDSPIATLPSISATSTPQVQGTGRSKRNGKVAK